MGVEIKLVLVPFLQWLMFIKQNQAYTQPEKSGDCIFLSVLAVSNQTCAPDLI